MTLTARKKRKLGGMSVLRFATVPNPVPSHAHVVLLLLENYRCKEIRAFACE